MACPGECPSFPFGTKAYNLWLRVDGSWQPKALHYIIRRLGKEKFEEMAQSFVPSWLEEEPGGFEQGVHAALLRCLSLPLNDGGRSIGDEWAAEDWVGLNNDERVMAQYRIRALPGILEIRRILDDTRVECEDLLDPGRGPFIVFDRSTASHAARFDLFLVWVVHYPHFSRLDGSGVPIQRNLITSFLEEIRARADTSSKKTSDIATKRYLAAHFGDAFELVGKLALDMRERMIRSLDVNHCRAWYRIKSSPSAIAAVLEAKPDFQADTGRKPEPDDPPDSRCFSWLRRGEAKRIERTMPSVFRHKSPEDGVGSLGNVRLSSDEFLLECFARRKFEFAKKLLKKYFGNDLVFLREEIVDLAQQALERSKDSADVPETTPESTIPPEVEKHLLEQFHRRHYEKFVDDRIPMLNGLTPRQAAVLPEMRPILIDLMKLHMQGLEKQSREKGLALDIDWLLKDLGLHELM